ncbi:MAG: hypothetical protein KAS23_04110, partial [Anaerohalosphaera sp.]|nr:hypothetical protein [Anaerohalosphaera sp.]
KGFLEATALAEYLVKKGVPFREAHGIVGTLVAHCEDNNCKLSDLTIDRFKQDCERIEADVHDTLSPAGVTNQYLTEGSGAPAQVEKQVQYWKNQLKEQ